MEKSPCQGSNVEITQARINSWAASHEEKWWHVPKQIKEKIQENQKIVKKGLQRQMIMAGGESK